MKISIGYKLETGPWGGGNRFVMDLVKALELRGHHVINHLDDSNVDIILIMDPRYRRHPSITFGLGKIIKYLLFKNPQTVVVHRINECDERKNTRHVNFLLRAANYLADHTVFIASWLIKLNVWRRESEFSVILNGANKELFHSKNKNSKPNIFPLEIVTHHWGANKMKGFDIYRFLDGLMSKPLWSERIRFTYIGNLPNNFKFKNTKHLLPKNGVELANCIRKNDIYLTASMNEPAGMHHIEGACCGLPLLYRNSGSLPEYCNGYGVEFNDLEDFEDKLELMISMHEKFVNKMQEYPNTSEKRIIEWVDLFETLHKQNMTISKKRKLLRNPFLLLFNLFL